MAVASKGRKFFNALDKKQPMQIMGVANAYTAMMAKKVGYQCLYLSGAWVANAVYGLPDLGLTSLTDVLHEVRKITSCVDTPLLVDCDTGWGGPLNVAHTVKEMIKAGAAGIHIEDQAWPKRCGHRNNKKLVSVEEMNAKLKAASDAKVNIDPHFVIMARTDAVDPEGVDSAVSRCQQYIESGADMIFAEAITDIKQLRRFRDGLDGVPILVNLTEFGKTPLFTTAELKEARINMALYPLTAFRAMNFAAMKVFKTVMRQGTQQSMIDEMQTRDDTYKLLNYYEQEKKVNQLYEDTES